MAKRATASRLLFEPPTSGNMPAPRAKKAEPAVGRLLDYFYRRFVERFNPPMIAGPHLAAVQGKPRRPSPFPKEQVLTPQIAGGKDGALLARLVAAWGEPGVRQIIDRMFGEARFDPRVVRSNHDVGALYACASYLRVRDQLPGDRRTAENLDAALRATGRRRRIGEEG